MPENTIPVGKYYNFDNKNVDVVYNPAKDENESGSGGVEDIDGAYLGNHQYSVNKPAAEIASAMQKGARIRASQEETTGGGTQTVSYYLSLAGTVYQNNAIVALLVTTPLEEGALQATESDGVTTFAPA